MKKITLPLTLTIGDHVYLTADNKTPKEKFSLYGKVTGFSGNHAKISMRNGTGMFRLNLETGQCAPYLDVHNIAFVRPAAQPVHADYNVEMDKAWLEMKS